MYWDIIRHLEPSLVDEPTPTETVLLGSAADGDVFGRDGPPEQEVYIDSHGRGDGDDQLSRTFANSSQAVSIFNPNVNPETFAIPNPAKRLRLATGSSIDDYLVSLLDEPVVLNQIPKQLQVENDGTIATLEKYKDSVRQLVDPLFMQYSYLVSFCIGIQCVCKLRVADISMYEQMLLIQLIEGERFLRAHDGATFYYGELGAWMPFNGV